MNKLVILQPATRGRLTQKQAFTRYFPLSSKRSERSGGADGNSKPTNFGKRLLPMSGTDRTLQGPSVNRDAFAADEAFGALLENSEPAPSSFPPITLVCGATLHFWTLVNGVMRRFCARVKRCWHPPPLAFSPHINPSPPPFLLPRRRRRHNSLSER